MKLFIVFFLVVTSAAASAADAAESKSRRSGAEVRKMLQKRRDESIARNGGMVYSQPDGKTVEIVNRQTVVPVGAIAEAVEKLRARSRIPVRVVGERTDNAGTWVELVCNDTDPSVLSAVDDGWARTNLRMLTTDGPDAEKLQTRLDKWMWRAVGASMGIGVSIMQPSIMGSFSRISELDAIPTTHPEPPMLNCFSEHSVHFGIEKVKMTTYRKACEEGWAPAPTNEIQKAIWDKVHAIPDKPMKVKFDPAAQKGKVTK